MYVTFTTFTSRRIAHNWFIVPDRVFPLFLLSKICNLMIIFKLVMLLCYVLLQVTRSQRNDNTMPLYKKQEYLDHQVC